MTHTVRGMTCHKCDTHDMCHNVTLKHTQKDKKCELGNEIDGTHCDIMGHFNMSVTPRVFKLIGPSNDGRRHM
jgi:hypothetical protein